MLLEGRPIVEKSGKIIGHRARFGGIHPSVMGFWQEFGEMVPKNSAMTFKKPDSWRDCREIIRRDQHSPTAKSRATKSPDRKVVRVRLPLAPPASFLKGRCRSKFWHLGQIISQPVKFLYSPA